MNSVSIAPVGTDDWEEVGHMTEPMSLEFTLQSVDPSVMQLYFGAQVEPPTHSVYITRTKEVSGRPEKPQHIPGLMAWLKGTNQKNQAAYLRDLFRWIGAGKPAKTIEIGTYIPRAWITPNPA